MIIDYAIYFGAGLIGAYYVFGGIVDAIKETNR